MDIRKVKKLIDLLEQSNLAEIEIKEGEESVRISRSSTSLPMVSYAPISATTSQTPSTTPNHSLKETSTGSQDQTITSPMVGTFYQSASPTSQPFIKVGQSIIQGDVICIIEAMKIMNKIETDQSGIIREILVKDGDAVEFGQDLVVIE